MYWSSGQRCLRFVVSLETWHLRLILMMMMIILMMMIIHDIKTLMNLNNVIVSCAVKGRKHSGWKSHCLLFSYAETQLLHTHIQKKDDTSISALAWMFIHVTFWIYSDKSGVSVHSVLQRRYTPFTRPEALHRRSEVFSQNSTKG